MKNRMQPPIAIIRKMINNGDLGEFIGKSYADKKALGGVLTAASTLLPMLGNIGSLLKGTQTGHPTRENTNPYGYQNGGPHDPPIKRQQMQQSTTAVNTPLPVYGDHRGIRFAGGFVHGGGLHLDFAGLPEVHSGCSRI